MDILENTFLFKLSGSFFHYILPKMLSPDVKEFFPYDQIRDGQKELINDVERTCKEQKILLAHAPTGLGKTVSSLAAILSYAIKEKKVVFFLTNRHTQHRIAVETIKHIRDKTHEPLSCVDLIGKRWMCNQEVSSLFGSDFNEFCKSIVEKGECEFYNNIRTKKGLSVPAQALIKELERQTLHNEELVARGKEEKMCSYEIAMAMAKKATVIIGDYYYLFNPFIQATLFTKMEKEMEDAIVIVDEGHNLPARVTDMVSNTLTSLMIKNAIMEARKYHYQGLIEWLQKLQEILTQLAVFDDASKEKKVSREQFSQKVAAFIDYENLIEELDAAADEVRKRQRKSYLGGIASFLEAWNGADDGFTRIINETETKFGPSIALKYLCLDPSIITKPVFSRVHAGVIMSGTLTPVSMYSDVLGIDNPLEREYHSPFPPENKLALVVPETTTKYTARNNGMYKEIAERCSTIASLVPGNVALFFPSYYVRDCVGEFFQSEKQLFWEKSSMQKEEKEQFLRDFRAIKETGGVLLGVTGANFAEGVDFPGDLLHGVVVIGIPLAKPDLKTKEVINYYQQKFGKGWEYGYTFPAISKCIQSAGRCIRSESDKGAVIYLDERFAWSRYYGCLPREGLIVSKEYTKYLTEFW